MSLLIEGLKRIFGSDKKLRSPAVRSIEEKLGIRFKNLSYIIEALTHKSVLGERDWDDEEINYERLEFLGDSVLSLVTSDYLMRKYPNDREGELTKKKSLLVSTAVLARRAEEFGIREYIILSDNAHRGGVANQDSVLAASMEAVIGAIYRDQGLSGARGFIEEFILRDMDQLLDHRDHVNYKSILQEWSQSEFKSYPRYTVKSTSGPEHNKMFSVEVNVVDKYTGRGRGKSKKDAEQMAAKDALEKLNKTGDVLEQ